MATWVIVRKSDLEVLGSYVADEKDDTSNNRSYLMAEPLAVHVELPEDVDVNCAMCELVEDEWELSNDSDKVQDRRDAKLERLRLLREPKLLECDVMINELVLAVRSDTAAVAAYRQELLDVTEDYKKVDGHAKAIIDDLDLDEVEWPTAP